MAIGDNTIGQGEHCFGVLEIPEAQEGGGKIEVVSMPPKRLRVSFTYRNYRGEVSTRVVTPCYIAWGANEWHKEEQWLLYAIDVEKNAARFFAMKDITGWMPVPSL